MARFMLLSPRMTMARADRGEAWVLVADADERAARALAGRFGRLGFWAYPTTRGEEALRLARAYRLTLAVVDIALGDMSGPELAGRLKALDDRLPLVITASDRGPESEILARESGIVYYAPKPINVRHIHAVAARATERRDTMSDQTQPSARPASSLLDPEGTPAPPPPDGTRRLYPDLRAPLNGILGFAELMRDGKAGPVTEMQREFLGHMLESARQLGRLLDDALGRRKEVAPFAPAAGSGQDAPGPRPATGVILLVDDEDDMRALIRESLEDAGYTVLEAREGDEALLVADWHDGPIDLVITDVMMPRVGGGELARRLAALRGTSRLLYISAYAPDRTAESGGVGDAPFLAKPFTPAALVAKVREVLARPAGG